MIVPVVVAQVTVMVPDAAPLAHELVIATTLAEADDGGGVDFGSAGAGLGDEHPKLLPLVRRGGPTRCAISCLSRDPETLRGKACSIVACTTRSAGLEPGADQPIRWARDTMIPSGPRTDAMRQMPSY